MEFKLNKLTLLLLSAPLIANASITHNGTNVLPSGLATSITDNQEHTINGFLTIAEGGKTTPEGQANGEMTIDNGSKLNISGTVMIGNQNNDGFGGKLTVTGAGSELNVGGLLNIGNYSNANLSILEGVRLLQRFMVNPTILTFGDGFFISQMVEQLLILKLLLMVKVLNFLIIKTH